MARLSGQDALIPLVADAVRSCYGIVDLAPWTRSSALRRRLRRDELARGIELRVDGERVSVDLAVIMEYGVPVPAVARNVISVVSFVLRQATGLTVERVDVLVRGLRESGEDEGASDVPEA